MKLPFLSKKEELEKSPGLMMFWIVRLTLRSVQTVLCSMDISGKATVVAESGFEEWDGNELGGLIEMIDRHLAELMHFLPEGREDLNRVLFGIPANWVESEQPLTEYREWLKEISRELELKPLGFAVVSEAVVNYLNQQELVPVTGVLVNLDRFEIELSLVFQGKVQQVEIVPRRDTVMETLEQSLGRFKSIQLPARMILFDGVEDLSPLKSELDEFDWEAFDRKFLQLPPKVDILQSAVALNALLIASGMALGQISVKIMEDEKSNFSKEVSGEQMETASVQGVTVEAEKSEGEEKSDELAGEVINREKELLSDEGFVLGQDIKELDMIGNEFGEEVVDSGRTEMRQVSHPVAVRNVETVNSVEISTPRGIIQKKGWLQSWTWKLGGVVMALMFIGGGLGYWWSTILRAEISLLVEPELLGNELMVTIDPAVQVMDVESGRLPGQVVKAEVSGVKSLRTSGKKIVGDKAKGKVIIYNDTEAVKNLEAGTMLTVESRGLKFNLDDDVQIASKSVDLSGDLPFRPGQVTAGVTAAEIGAEYNLEVSSLLTVANFSQSSLLAKNDGTFSGGSSREVQAVAKEDLEKLRSDLRSELESQALGKLSEKIGQNLELIGSSVKVEVIDEKFDQEFGDEAESVSLNLGLRFTGIGYSQADLDDLIKRQLTARVPAQKELSDMMKSDFQLIEGDDGDGYRFRVVTESYLLPKLSADNIKEKVRGKRSEVVRGYLFSLPGVKEVKYVIFPKLPSFLDFLSWFPFSVGKISLEIIPLE